MMYQTPTLPKVARGEYLAASCKKGYQANLPCPQITVITNELCIFITRDALLWKDLGWEIFVR